MEVGRWGGGGLNIYSPRIGLTENCLNSFGTKTVPSRNEGEERQTSRKEKRPEAGAHVPWSGIPTGPRLQQTHSETRRSSGSDLMVVIIVVVTSLAGCSLRRGMQQLCGAPASSRSLRADSTGCHQQHPTRCHSDLHSYR